MEIYVKCRRCGRKLKNPIYQKLGYGKVCYNKMVAKKYNNKKLMEIKAK